MCVGIVQVAIVPILLLHGIAPFIHSARRDEHYRRIKDLALVNPGARQSAALLGGDLTR